MPQDMAAQMIVNQENHEITVSTDGLNRPVKVAPKKGKSQLIQ